MMGHKPIFGIIGSSEFEATKWVHDGEPTNLQVKGEPTRCRRLDTAAATIYYLTRNSTGTALPSHLIDYRANLVALQDVGVTQVLATSIAGSLNPALAIGTILIPDQFLDFTRNRQFTAYTGTTFAFADMTDPYCSRLRAALITAGQDNLTVVTHPSGCYVGTDGPRFETRAEVRMYQQLGGDIIGMTSTTESIIARELGMCYASAAGIVNLGAGLSNRAVQAPDWIELREVFAERFVTLFKHSINFLSCDDRRDSSCPCSQLAPTE